MEPATDELLDTLWAPSSKRKARPQDLKWEDAAMAKVIRDEEGRVGIPSDYILAALNYAGKFVKFDKRKFMANKDSSLVPALLNFLDEFYPFKNQEEPIIPVRNRGRLPKDGTAVCIVRPKIRNWEMELVVEFDDDEIEGDKVKDLFVQAGKKAGLGGWRPACKGKYGKFTVTKFEVVEQAVPLKKAA